VHSGDQIRLEQVTVSNSPVELDHKLASWPSRESLRRDALVLFKRSHAAEPEEPCEQRHQLLDADINSTRQLNVSSD